MQMFGKHWLFGAVLVMLFGTTTVALAQKKSVKPDASQPPHTPAKTRLAGFEQRQKLLGTSLVGNVQFRNIGPTVMSGRVVDVEAYAQDPTRFYVAYASGGLWRSTTNGISFEPLFDNHAVMTIGDIAVQFAAKPQNDVIWLGTGENNS